ncbi:zinc finger SWIM domain-containing protein 1-like isoform X2 [Narcine bancroftii]
MSQVTGFRVGAEFSSYSELHREYRRYQKDCAVQMWTRHSRTIEAQRRRAPKRPMNDALKFAEIDYACIHGGKLFKTKGSGKRPNQKTNKMKCPCVIKVRLSANGNKFVVKEMNESHNHTTKQVKAGNRSMPGGNFKPAVASKCQAAQTKIPRQRRSVKVLCGDVASDALKQSNGGCVKEELQKVTVKVPIQEDVQNQEDADKCGDVKVEKTDLEMMVPTLAAVKDGTVVVVVSKANVLQAIYYQDCGMKQAFESFPEVLLLDAACSWEDLQLPSYLLLAINGNGESELVCLWFLQKLERETFRQLLRIFARKNPASERTRVVVSSNEACGGELVSDALPGAKLLSCLAHTLLTFQRDVTTEKLQVSDRQRDQILQTLHSMCYASSAEEYDLLYRQLLDTKVQGAVDYFNTTWHGSRHQWVEGLKHENESYLTSTVHRVQALSRRLRDGIGEFSDSTSFTRGLLKALDSLRAERDDLLRKVPPDDLEPDPVSAAYRRLLTHFAFCQVQRELEAAEGVCLLGQEAERAWPVARRRAIVTGLADCQCAFRTSMKLPCRHILAFRRLKGSDLFQPSLCAGRWTQLYLLLHRPAPSSSCLPAAGSLQQPAASPKQQ